MLVYFMKVSYILEWKSICLKLDSGHNTVILVNIWWTFWACDMLQGTPYLLHLGKMKEDQVHTVHQIVI